MFLSQTTLSFLSLLLLIQPLKFKLPLFSQTYNETNIYYLCFQHYVSNDSPNDIIILLTSIQISGGDLTLNINLPSNAAETRIKDEYALLSFKIKNTPLKASILKFQTKKSHEEFYSQLNSLSKKLEEIEDLDQRTISINEFGDWLKKNGFIFEIAKRELKYNPIKIFEGNIKGTLYTLENEIKYKKAKIHPVLDVDVAINNNGKKSKVARMITEIENYKIQFGEGFEKFEIKEKDLVEKIFEVLPRVEEGKLRAVWYKSFWFICLITGVVLLGLGFTVVLVMKIYAQDK